MGCAGSHSDYCISNILPVRVSQMQSCSVSHTLTPSLVACHNVDEEGRVANHFTVQVGPLNFLGVAACTTHRKIISRLRPTINMKTPVHPQVAITDREATQITTAAKMQATLVASETSRCKGPTMSTAATTHTRHLQAHHLRKSHKI